MMQKVVILGSTGSIGTSTLKSLAKTKNFKVFLLTANQDIKKLLKQCILYKVPYAIIENTNNFKKYKSIFKKKKINLYKLIFSM